MRLALTPHPDFPCPPVHEMAVDVTRTATGLVLRYNITGDLSRVVLPDEGPRGRADELWKHSCFEAFILADEGYVELNLSPSDQWAAYHFDSYRSGMAPAEATLVGLNQHRAPDHYEITANLDLSGAGLPARRWKLGLSAVVELTDGARGYFALRHAPGQPDFHHADAFNLNLDPS